MSVTRDSYVIGLDLGTTNYKAIVYDASGNILGIGSASPAYVTDDTGRCELPVEQCHQLVRTALTGAAEAAGVPLSSIQGIGYSSQANTFILLDADYQPLTPFIVWTDTRAKSFPPAFQALAEEDRFLHTVGFNSIFPGMMVANVGWIKTHQPEVWQATRYIMTLPDYLVFHLTGNRIGDSGSCALLGLWDIPNNRYWPEALAAAGLDEQSLPHLAYPGTTAGLTSASATRDSFGLRVGIPVVVGSLDHHVAAIGAGAGKVAPFSISTGTVLAATCLDSRYATHPACCLGPGMNGNGYYRLAWHNNGTRALNWYREKYAPGYTIDELLALAESVDPATPLPAVRLCPWEAPEEPMFSGSSTDNPGVCTLAILSSTADLLKDMLHLLQPDLVSQGIVVTGGGARSQFWMQMIANKINAPVYRSSSEQAGCLGAAVLAAVGAGLYETIEQASESMVKISDCLKPSATATNTAHV